MSNQQTAWLVAYDICEPRRLRRVHRLLRKEGVAAQYSAFMVEGNDDQILHLLARLRTMIDKCADDIRVYHLPQRCTVWSLGTQQWPQGMSLTATDAARLLVQASTPIDQAAEPVDSYALQPST